MTEVRVHRLTGEDLHSTPMLAELDRLMCRVKQRAFERFAQRGYECGHELDDWLAAERETFGVPAAGMVDRGGEIEIEVALPGYEAGEIEVAATENGVVVHAEPRRETNGPGQVLWSELEPAGNVYRDFELPLPADLDHISARLENGILHITAPKKSPEPLQQQPPVEAVVAVAVAAKE